MKTYRDLVAEAKRAVPEVTVEDVQRRLARGEAVDLIDVRDPDEYREGAVGGRRADQPRLPRVQGPGGLPGPRDAAACSTASPGSARSSPARCSTTSGTPT